MGGMGGMGGTDWPAAWVALTGWKRWPTVSGAGHFGFTDLPVLAAGPGLPDPSGSLPADRGRLITRACAAAVLDRHLRDVPQPLLDGPTDAYPEVAFHGR
jgi:hypothetical protein